MTEPHPKFQTLTSFLSAIPGIKIFSSGDLPSGGWWVKLDIDIRQGHAWHLVQELGYVLNNLSVQERLPTVFKPVSPPPYLNGGPSDYLSWVIECPEKSFAPGTAQKWLEGRLPNPAHKLSEWQGLDE
ncbi:hypothetical protein [Shimia sagamensis]|uniref:hypothetical protein n=1 Tax=Shimia sagamensis TaxID=1566352 RepID=UPI0024B85D75|nr:hypothetical protein [Shimia sagamensis]